MATSTASGHVVDPGPQRAVELDGGGSRLNHGRHGVDLVEREAQAQRLAGQEGRAGRRGLARTVAQRGEAEHGREDLDPYRQSGPGAAERHPFRCRAAEAPDRDHFHHPRHVPGDRLHDGARHVRGAVRRTEPHEPGAGIVPPPRGAGAVEPGHGDHAARAGAALRRQASQLLGAAVEQAAEPGQEGAGRRQPAFEQPAPVRGPGHHGADRRRDGALLHRHGHVGRGAPAHHGVVLRRARTEHLALPVTGPDDDRDPWSQPELGRRYRLELADDGVGRHHAGELAQSGAGQFAHGVAVEVVEPAARREGGIGHQLIGHAVHDEVARRQNHVSRLNALGLVLGQPGQLGRNGAGIERDPGPGPVDVVASHALGQHPRLGGGPVVRPQDGLADRVTLRGDGDEGLPRPRTGHHVDLGEGERRLGPGLGARDDERGPPPQRILLGPADLGEGGGELGAGERHQALVAPQADLGDGRAEVDREDHRPCTSARTRPAASAGSGSW